MSAQPPQPPVSLSDQEFHSLSPDSPPPRYTPPPIQLTFPPSTNSEYDYIDPARLASLRSGVLDQFRSFIPSMSPAVLFTSVHKLPFRGTCLITEADVTSYLDTQVIVAAWQAVLKIVPPTDRAYDLMTIRQMHLGVNAAPFLFDFKLLLMFSVAKAGFLDQLFGIYTSTGRTGYLKFTPVGIMELKSPCVAHGLRSTFQARRADKQVDPTANWVRVTSQLRKYVVTPGVLDILLMDYLCAIYFRFPSADQVMLFEQVEFIIAPSDHDAPPADGLSLTVREVIVLACCRALNGTGIAFRSFGDTPFPPTDQYEVWESRRSLDGRVVIYGY